MICCLSTSAAVAGMTCYGCQVVLLLKGIVFIAGSQGPQLNAVRRSMLVVRTVATVANYDYIYDIRFLPDASIQVDVRMAGYIVASYYGPNGETVEDDPFGARVHNNAFGKLHDHLSGWKVDIDVIGTTNSIRKQVQFVHVSPQIKYCV